MLLIDILEDSTMHMIVCAKSVFRNVVNQAVGIVLLVMLYGLIVRIPFVRKYRYIFHIVSFLFGCNLLHHFVLDEAPLKYVFAFVITTYLCIIGTTFMDLEDRENVPVAYVLSTCIYLYICEHIYPKVTYNLEARGLIMIIALKGTMMAIDISERFIKILDPIEYLGYMLSPANVAFGPCLSFSEYVSIIRKPRPIDWAWFCALIRCFTFMFAALVLATCQDLPKQTSFYESVIRYITSLFTGPPKIVETRWWDAYLSALSFRASHYFISFFSELTMIAAGYAVAYRSRTWSLPISLPGRIEFPRSLHSVAASWNIPMNTVLRRIYFQPLLRKGRTFATIGTYLVSSMFHGFNIEVTFVLMHFSLFSVIQYKFRTTLSEYFNACLKVRYCKRCLHRYKSTNVLVFFANVFFSLLTMIDLIYLGVLMSNVGVSNNYKKSVSIILQKWTNLYFISHFIHFIFLMGHLMLEIILIWRRSEQPQRRR